MAILLPELYATETFIARTITARSIHNPLTPQSATEIIDVGSIGARQIQNFFLVSIPGTEIWDPEKLQARSIFLELLPARGYEIIDQKLILANYEMLAQCVLSITLEPGETLIIDAENYTVTKDGAEYTGAHSGEWIDQIDRGTDVISIQNGSGSTDYEATVKFTERYK